VPSVVGVVFQNGGKIYHFDPGTLQLDHGDRVVVQTMRGTEIGEVVDPPKEISEQQLPAPLKRVVRLATDKDMETMAANEALRHEALSACKKLVAQHGLEMKVVDAEIAFGGGKVTFSFYSEERVDFRALVVDLARVLKMRIELRQIGVRDEARILGGLGPCGRHFCCTLFPVDQEPVSIRMAKEQNLPLNPMKISGLCGRLMCCLKYEQEQYVCFRKEAPRRGTVVQTPKGAGAVVGYQVPKNSLTVRLEDGGTCDVPITQCICPDGRPCGSDKPCGVQEEGRGVEAPSEGGPISATGPVLVAAASLPGPAGVAAIVGETDPAENLSGGEPGTGPIPPGEHLVMEAAPDAPASGESAVVEPRTLELETARGGSGEPDSGGGAVAGAEGAGGAEEAGRAEKAGGAEGAEFGAAGPDGVQLEGAELEESAGVGAEPTHGSLESRHGRPRRHRRRSRGGSGGTAQAGQSGQAGPGGSGSDAAGPGSVGSGSAGGGTSAAGSAGDESAGERSSSGGHGGGRRHRQTKPGTEGPKSGSENA
jgi:cell fate regulator YaaT (PSP1 superfamily)